MRLQITLDIDLATPSGRQCLRDAVDLMTHHADQAVAPPLVLPDPPAVVRAEAPAEVVAVPDDGWTGREDLAVLAGFRYGEPAHVIARDLSGRRAKEVVARFRQLVPKNTPDAIERALAVAASRA